MYSLDYVLVIDPGNPGSWYEILYSHCCVWTADWLAAFSLGELVVGVNSLYQEAFPLIVCVCVCGRMRHG